MNFEEIYQWICENDDIHSGLRCEEARFLYQCAMSVPRGGVILECGAWKCASTNVLAAAASRIGCNVVSIDKSERGAFFVPPHVYETKSLIHPGLQDKVCFVTKDVFDALSIFRNERTVSFALIDDDHTYPHVARVASAVLPLMKNNGIVLFHDANIMGIPRSINELMAGGAFTGWTEIETPFAQGDLLQPRDDRFFWKTDPDVNYWSIRAFKKEW